MSIVNTFAAAAALTLSLLAGATALPTAAVADDDDIICFDFIGADGETEVECGTRGDYKAECKLVDPENTVDFCQDVNSARPARPEAQSLTGGEAGGGGIQPPTIGLK